MKIISKYKDENFAKVTIPQLIINTINDTLYVVIKNEEHLAMSDYLKDNYDIDFEEVFKEVTLDKFLVTKINGQYMVQLDPRIKLHLKGYTLVYILTLIDGGNLDVKGLHIVDKAFKYVKSNLEDIYRLHLKGGI